MRTFVAVELTEELRAVLVSARGSLLQGVRGARAVRPEALHVTVQFLGETPAAGVQAVYDALDRVARQTRPFDTRITRFAAAPSVSRPRVVWAAVDDPDLLFRQLAVRVGEALGPLGFPPEERAFTPHVTVARMRSGRGDPRLTAALRDATSEAMLPVRGLTLFESVLEPRGAHYTPLCRVPFPSTSPQVTLSTHGADS